MGVQVAQEEAEGGDLGDGERVARLRSPVGHAGHAPPDPVVVGIPAVAGVEGLARAGLACSGATSNEPLRAESVVDALVVGAVGGGELEDAGQRSGEEQEEDGSGGGERHPAVRASAEEPARERGAKREGGRPGAREESAEGEVVAGGGPDIGRARQDGGLEVAAVVVARVLAREPGVVRGVVG